MSAKKPAQYRPTRESLLHELEDLKLSLSSDEESVTMPIEEDPTEIPVLTDTQGSKKSAPPDPILDEPEDDVELVDEEESQTTAEHEQTTPGQQPLFDDIVPEKSRGHKTTAKGENPFLPEHIRERLTQNKNSILEELAHVGESLSKHDSRLKDSGIDAHVDTMVDELIAKYLPQIEQELRAKLKQQLKE